jgi:hypothetical protein
MITSSATHRNLFASFAEAREAYLRLEDRGPDMTDAELARDADYRALFSAGRKLERFGGIEALDGAVGAFFPGDVGRTAVARSNLDHWWAGFGTWWGHKPMRVS